MSRIITLRPVSPQTQARLDDALPPYAAMWMRNALGDVTLPTESAATCTSCAMTALDPGTCHDDEWFNSQTKCCTYIPDLPNFLVGYLLVEQDNHRGVGSVSHRVTQLDGVNPYGIEAPYRYKAAFPSLQASFGTDPSMICPHFVTETGQ